MNRFTLFFLLIVVGTGSFAQDLFDSLMVYLPFDNSLDDHLGKGNHGIAIGSPTFTKDRFGKENSAILLDGENDYIVIGHFEEFNTDTISISFWMRADSKELEDDPGFDYRIEALLYKGATTAMSDYTHSVYLSQVDGSNMISIRNKSVANSTQYTTSLDNISIGEDRWYHVVGVLKGKNYKFYIDGKFIGEQNQSAFINKNSTDITIGKSPGFTTKRNFKGAIDDFRIYYQALSEEEVSFLFNETITSTREQIPQETIKVYPNPCVDVMEITLANWRSDESNTLVVFNSLGKKVYEKEIGTKSITINCDELGSSGVYFINVLSENGILSQSRKLIIY